MARQGRPAARKAPCSKLLSSIDNTHDLNMGLNEANVQQAVTSLSVIELTGRDLIRDFLKYRLVRKIPICVSLTVQGSLQIGRSKDCTKRHVGLGSIDRVLFHGMYCSWCGLTSLASSVCMRSRGDVGLQLAVR